MSLDEYTGWAKRAGYEPPTVTDSEIAEIEGAVEMARHWVHNPSQMVDAGFEQVCRELYTISRALIRLGG